MRIVSPFKDYYDGLQKNDQDKTTTFVRPNTQDKKVEVPKELEDIADTQFLHNYQMYCVGFIDQIYWGPKSKVDAFLNPRDSITNRIWFGSGMKFCTPNEILSKWQNKSAQLFELLGPMWKIYDIGWEDKKKIIYFTAYPKMEPYLANVLPPHEAYDKLYRYVCNKGNPVRPIPEMKNDVKIQLAGFDLETSFRKPKEKK